jgi:hypothetical protein
MGLKAGEGVKIDFSEKKTTKKPTTFCIGYYGVMFSVLFIIG